MISKACFTSVIISDLTNIQSYHSSRHKSNVCFWVQKYFFYFKLYIYLIFLNYFDIQNLKLKIKKNNKILF
jgi:hypothetical protein